MEKKGMKIGEIIKQVRTKLQLRQADVAKLSGVNHQGSLTYDVPFPCLPNWQ
jgi:transcriptional regulator with XRE-family HTH domain